jgi:hypothetical protein
MTVGTPVPGAQGAGSTSQPAAILVVGRLASGLLPLEKSDGAIGVGRPGGGVPGLFGYTAPKVPDLLQQLAPTIATAGSAAAAWAAFSFFGRRRRDDGDETEPDGTLATAAAAGYEAQAVPGLPAVDESLLPRWRRPSLQRVRKADPLRAEAETPHMSFETTGAAPIGDHGRRRIGYRLVRLLDSPDELRSQEIGILDQGDEVQLVQRHGAYWLVLCPDGKQGWVHRMVLADGQARPADPEPTAPEPDEKVVAYEMPGLDEMAEEPATGGLLAAYMKAKSHLFKSTRKDQPVEPEPLAEAAAADAPGAPAKGAAARAKPTKAKPTKARPDPAVSAATVDGASDGQTPAAAPGRAGARYSGRKSAGTRKAATASRPGTKSRRPSR